MKDAFPDIDKWQVFEVTITDSRMPKGNFSEAIERIAADNNIPAVVRFDSQNSRHLIATPTDRHYDDLIGKVDEHFQEKFDARMATLKSRYGKDAPPREPPKSSGETGQASKQNWTGEQRAASRMGELRARYARNPEDDYERDQQADHHAPGQRMT